jgi:glycosyltransferase involved in cell wall biosynthesis
LATLLKAAEGRQDIRFAVACPSWLRRPLAELCDEEGVDAGCFDIIAPAKRPLALVLRERLLAARTKPRRRGALHRLRVRLRRLWAGRVERVTRWAVSRRSPVPILGLGLVAAPAIAVGGVIVLLLRAARRPARRAARLRRSLLRGIALSAIRPVARLIAHPGRESLGLKLFALMEESELALVHALIGQERDIAAWYSPAAFWPDFNRIDAPRLMCVPDLVLTDFPGGFAAIGDSASHESFRRIERAVAAGDQFVTYSQHVKWHTLVGHCGVDPDAIHVIPHGASRLSSLIEISGFADRAAATRRLCRNLLWSSLAKAVGSPDAQRYGGDDVQFLFYASQFRPNKNIVTLLRAYEHLLRQRYCGHKLILTGNPARLAEVGDLIAEHRLTNDVLCLHGLTVQELAACYRLADLAVNPSLSEGGFPFTFCEAVSVGTPVVMARIAVTEEVLTDPALLADTTFDPYDWRDLAARIEWALDHRAALYQRQRDFYDKVLAQRTWADVVDEHLAILDSLAARSSGQRPPSRGACAGGAAARLRDRSRRDVA